MTILKLTKSMSRMALLGSAVFLLHPGNVLAADRADDAQAHARELLDRTAKRSIVVATSPALLGTKSEAALEPQEQARRLILGTPRAAAVVKRYAALDSKITSPSGTDRQGIRRAYPDGQALAKRMITGS